MINSIIKECFRAPGKLDWLSILLLILAQVMILESRDQALHQAWWWVRSLSPSAFCVHTLSLSQKKKKCFKVPFPLCQTGSVSKVKVRALILFLDAPLFGAAGGFN